MKKILVGIGVLAVFLFAVQSSLPSVADGLIKGAIVSTADVDDVTVETHKTPAMLMLLGKFDSIDVSAQGLKSGKVKFQSFDVELKNIHIDISEVLLHQQLSVESMDSAKLRAEFAEDDLAALLNRSMQGLTNATVRILPGGVKVGGEFNVGGLLKTLVEIDGNIIEKNNAIVFRTGQFSIAQGSLGRFGGNLATDIVLVDLNSMPFDVKVKNIILKDGVAEIYADSVR